MRNIIFIFGSQKFPFLSNMEIYFISSLTRSETY